MSARPNSVTVAAIIIMVLSGFGLLSMLFLFEMKDSPLMQQALQANPTPVPVQIGIGLTGSLLCLACGILLLLRHGWVRYVYIVWSVGSIVYGFITSPTPLLMIPGTVIFLVLAYFLFTPAARAWFGKQDAAPAA